MKGLQLVTISMLVMTVVSFSFGCTSVQSNPTVSQPTAAETKLTKVTKEILKTRLAGKNVQFVEKLPDSEKPNPLFLSIKIVGSGADAKSPLKVTLNNGDKQVVSDLITQLNSIFKERTANGFFLEGKNEVDKRLNIAASEADIAFYNKENIYVEDFEKLIDDLHKAAIDQIFVNLVGSAAREISLTP